MHSEPCVELAAVTTIKLPRPPEHPDGPGEIEIEVDRATGKAQIVKVVMLVGGYNPKQAIKQFNRILNDPKRQELNEKVGEPMRVNGRGQACYCASGTLMHMILMCLPPGRLSNKYMAECARVLHMRDAGDSRLVVQVEHNRQAAVENGGVPPKIRLFGAETKDHEIKRTLPPLAISPSETAIEYHVSDGESATSPGVLFDLMQTLVKATGWDLQQALDMWLALCEEHPQFRSCRRNVNGTVAYITQKQLLCIYDIEPAIEWASCILEYVEQPESQVCVDDSRLTCGIFYPTILWTPPRSCSPRKMAWVETFVDNNGTMCVDFDRMLQMKYSLNAKAAGELRSRRLNLDGDFAANVFKTVDAHGISRWCTYVTDISKIILKITMKRDAEAERMHEHSLAQLYIVEGLCDIEVVCRTCASVDLVNINGQRIREKKWRGYALDIGIVFGNDVVGAIEILNTCPVSAKKIRELMTEGVPFAEVKAAHVLSAFRNKVSVVRAVRGHGFCKHCKQKESSTLLLCAKANCDEREKRARKHKSEAENDLRDIAIEKGEISRKLRRLAVI
jgi:hypothetical protein